MANIPAQRVNFRVCDCVHLSEMPPAKEPTWKEIGEGIGWWFIPYQIWLVAAVIVVVVLLVRRLRSQSVLTTMALR